LILFKLFFLGYDHFSGEVERVQEVWNGAIRLDRTKHQENNGYDIDGRESGQKRRAPKGEKIIIIVNNKEGKENSSTRKEGNRKGVEPIAERQKQKLLNRDSIHHFRNLSTS
jgi:hypothetical protein